MKIQYASDIHLEHNVELSFHDVIDTRVGADVLILAGDIGCPRHESFKNFLLQCCKHFKTTVLVPGNHEYMTSVPWTIEETNLIMRNICKSVSFLDRERGGNNTNKVVLLTDGEHICVGNDVIIHGTTLWSNIPRDSKKKDVMELFNGLYVGDKRPINAETYRELHNDQLIALSMSIREGCEKRMKNIVVTHYAPVPCEKSDKQFMYWTDLTDNINYGLVHTWVYGHTHTNNIQNVHGTMVLSNQLGRNAKTPLAGWNKGSVFTV